MSSESKNRFVSAATKERLMQKFLDASEIQAAEFANAVRQIPELAEFVGRYLERNFHRKIVVKGVYEVMNLDSRSASLTRIELPSMTGTVRFTREDFMDIPSVIPNHYYLPSRTNFPRLDSFAVLPATLFLGPRARGFILVIFQVTKSKSHNLNGAIVKRLQERVKSLGVKFSQTLFVWVSSPGGILESQTVKTKEGDAYVQAGPSNMTQWLLVFGEEYNDLFRTALALD